MLTASHTGAIFILACPQLFRCLTPPPDSLCSLAPASSRSPTLQGCLSAQQCQEVPWSCIPAAGTEHLGTGNTRL